MSVRMLLIAAMFAVADIAQAQRVIYSSYPVGDELVVNNQLCCYGESRTGWFQYEGETARLHTLSLDAGIYYSGFLEVSFLRWNEPGDETVLETWTGTWFTNETPLSFTRDIDVLGGQIFGVRVNVMPGDDPDPQTIASAAIWRENLERESLWGFTSYVYEVTVEVDEPGALPLLLTVGLLLAGQRRALRAGRAPRP